jgi:hypothetical protein
MNRGMAETIPKGPIPFWQEDVGRAPQVMEDMRTSLFHDSRACRKIGFTNISRLAGFIGPWGKGFEEGTTDRWLSIHPFWRKTESSKRGSEERGQFVKYVGNQTEPHNQRLDHHCQREGEAA